MGRRYSVDMHAVNVSAHPHPEGVYEGLLKRIYSAKRPVQIWGDKYALMTELHWQKDKKTGKRQSSYGIISTFTDIDLDAPWLDRNTGRAAEDADTDRIVIPDGLRPHFAQFRFHFDLDVHVLAFQGNVRMPKRTGGFKLYNFTPIHMENYLGVLLRDPEIIAGIEQFSVTVVPDPDTLNGIVSHTNIIEIALTFMVPNSDNVATLLGAVANRLRAMNVYRNVDVYTAHGAEGVKPDPLLMQSAQVAALDGKVTARVATNDGVIQLSTEDKPLTHRAIVDTYLQPEEEVVRAELQDMAKSVGGD